MSQNKDFDPALHVGREDQEEGGTSKPAGRQDSGGTSKPGRRSEDGESKPEPERA